MKKILFLLTITVLFVSCTENKRARKYGGKETVKIKPDHRFINITWKGDDLWVITEDTNTHIFYATEKSSYGLMEGQIEIKK